MGKSTFSRLMENLPACPVCSDSRHWGIDASRRMLLCVAPNVNDPSDICGATVSPADVFDEERQLLFKRLLDISRVFPSN